MQSMYIKRLMSLNINSSLNLKITNNIISLKLVSTSTRNPLCYYLRLKYKKIEIKSILNNNFYYSLFTNEKLEKIYNIEKMFLTKFNQTLKY